MPITLPPGQAARSTSKCKKNSGLRTLFHSSATRLGNKTEPSLGDTLSQKRFLRDLQRKIALENSVTERFNTK